MIFEPSKLFAPNDDVITTLTNRLELVTIHVVYRFSGVYRFFEKNVCLDKITLTAIESFPLSANVLGCCRQDHCDLFLTYFYRSLLRLICKDKNSSVSEASKSKYRKLNI